MRLVCGDTKRSLAGRLPVDHLLGNEATRSWAKESENDNTKMRDVMKCGATAAIAWNHIINNKIANPMINRIDQCRLSERN